MELEIRLTSPSVEADSIDIVWALRGDNSEDDIEQVFISAAYTGPCIGAQVPPKAVTLNPPMSDTYTITGLQEFAVYMVNVTVVTGFGVGTDIREFRTKGVGMCDQCPALPL